MDETTSIFTTGFSAADLRHGPIAIASEGATVHWPLPTRAQPVRTSSMPWTSSERAAPVSV